MDGGTIVTVSIAISVVIALSIPLAIYLTYPVDQQEPVEQVVEDIYREMPIPRPPPRFIHGVYGYAAFRGTGNRVNGFFLWMYRDVGAFTVDGDTIPVIFMSRYRCLAEGRYIDGVELARYVNGTRITAVGYLFRTPRGLVFIPVEIHVGNMRFVYTPR